MNVLKSASIILFFLINFFVDKTMAQNAVQLYYSAGNAYSPNYDAFRSDKIAQTGEGSFSGDLNISIPVITIPGKNGYNFDLTLTYNSNISQRQKASWVGFGWSLDIGHVERTVYGRPDDKIMQYTGLMGAGVEETRLRARSRLMTPADDANTVNSDQVDSYVLNIQGETDEILPFTRSGVNVNTDSVLDRSFFLPLKYKPMRIMAGGIGVIPNFQITKNDGTMYNFGGVGTGGGGYELDQVKLEQGFSSDTYIYRWSLKEIVYRDNAKTNIHYNPTHSNSYVKRQHDNIYIDRGHFYKYFNDPNVNFYGSPNDIGGTVHFEYGQIDSIETDTHVARFFVSHDITTDRNQRLDAIVITDKFTRKEIKRVLFNYAVTANDAAEWNITQDETHNNGNNPAWNPLSPKKLKDNQLTLLSFNIQNGSSVQNDSLNYIPPYQFSYTNNPKLSVYWLAIHDYVADFYPGYILDARIGTAWKLKTIKTPTGGTITYEYDNLPQIQTGPENESIHYYAKQRQLPRSRLSKKLIVDPNGNSREFNYFYGTVKYYAPNRPLLVNYTPKNARNPADLSPERYYRGCSPGHDWVEVSSNGEKKKIHYNTTDDEFYTYLPLSVSVVAKSNSAIRGTIIKEETNNDTTIYDYNFSVQRVINERYEYGTDPNESAVWGRRARIEYQSVFAKLTAVTAMRDGVRNIVMYNYNVTEPDKFSIGFEFPFFDNGLISAQFEVLNGKSRHTKYKYAAELYPDMDNKSMKSQLYSVEINEEYNPTPISKSYTEWKKLSNNWLPYREWVWDGTLEQSYNYSPKYETIHFICNQEVQGDEYDRKQFRVSYRQIVQYSSIVNSGHFYIGTGGFGSSNVLGGGSSSGTFEVEPNVDYYAEAFATPCVPAKPGCFGYASAWVKFDTAGGPPPTYFQTKQYDRYNIYGNVLEETNANGTKTFYYYGDNSNPFSNTPTTFKNSYLTGIKYISENSIYQMSMKYDEFGNIIEKKDPNTNALTAQYDPLGRLKSVFGPNGLTLNSHQYRFMTGAYSRTNPHYSTTTIFRASNDSTVHKTFYDGFGLDIQQHISFGTEDIISHHHRDGLFRIDTSYKPYQKNTGHTFDPSYSLSAKNYYNNNVYGWYTDDYPYSVTSYTTDNTNRVIKQKFPGSVFQSDGTPRSVRYGYDRNRSSSDVTGYAANILYKKATTDENGIISTQYHDVFGNLIQSVIDSAGLKFITKFEYDILGKPTKVTNHAGQITNYYYNSRGLLVKKKSVDADSVKYLYDKAGNLRLIKDGNHTGNANNYHFSTLGLVYPNSQSGSFALTMPGKVTISVGVVSVIDYGVVTLRIKKNGTVLYSIMTNEWEGASLSFYLPKGSYEFQAVTSGLDGQFSYSISCTANYEFVYNKYDALNRLIETGEYESNVVTNFTLSNAENTAFPASSKLPTKEFSYDYASGNPLAAGQRNLKGRLSYEKSYNLGALALETFYSYDEYGRVEWLVHYGHGYNAKKMYYKYDLQGNITRKIYDDAYSFSYRLCTFYEYDQAGRLSKVYTGTDSSGSGKIQEAWYHYFASGKVKQVQLGATPAQTVDYRYNERDWLTTMNDVNNLGSDKFAAELQYHTGDLVGTAKYNGNITGMKWHTPAISTDPKMAYQFSYDNANRLTYAQTKIISGGAWANANKYSITLLNYDPVGNITKLRKRGSGSADFVDNLTYNYIAGTNKLHWIDDLVSSSAYPGDIDDQSSGNYVYDANGSMIQSLGDSIAFVQYDIDNLPVRVYKLNSTMLFYSYDTKGNRIRKKINSLDEYYINGADGKTDVIAPVTGNNYTFNIYGDDNFGQIKHTMGESAPILTRYYYLKDHLGSNRVTVNSSGTVVGYNDFYPFGMIMDGRSSVSGVDARYKFIGKERDWETGYDWLSARGYDARIGRFLSIDPLASQFPQWSPYHYSYDNPILFQDANGKNPALYYLAVEIIKFTGLGVILTQMVSDPAVQKAVGEMLNSVSEGAKTLIESGAKSALAQDADGMKLGQAPYDKPLPKDEHGNAIPDKKADGNPHTQVGERESKKRGEKYPQAREWDEKGKKVRDIDFTDHGRPKNHPNPHQHRYDPKTGKRLDPEPLQIQN